MSCCGARKIHRKGLLVFFDRCHSLLLALSATGSARKRPHFDTSPYLLPDYCIKINSICQLHIFMLLYVLKL